MNLAGTRAQAGGAAGGQSRGHRWLPGRFITMEFTGKSWEKRGKLWENHRHVGKILGNLGKMYGKTADGTSIACSVYFCVGNSEDGTSDGLTLGCQSS